MARALCADEPTLELWPDDPPGRIAAEGIEGDTSGPDSRQVAGHPVIRLGNVSTPTLTVYSPKEEKNTGAAVLVCPGGGYSILAYDLEGTEVCEWLNSIGVTGILLKYRVPKPPGEARPLEPLQDAQRAMSLIRQHADQWGIDPGRIGVLGFSAGGNLAARLSTNYGQRTYQLIDAADQASCRPDFGILIYPAYLYEKRSDAETLRPLVTEDLPVDRQTPPMFLTMAFDDRVGPENILRFGLAMKEAEVPAEIHLFPDGGHGYGLRRTDNRVTTWPELAAGWLEQSGWLKSR